MSSSASPRAPAASYLSITSALLHRLGYGNARLETHGGFGCLALGPIGRSHVAITTAPSAPSERRLQSVRGWLRRQACPAMVAILHPSEDPCTPPRVHLVWRRGEFAVELPDARLTVAEEGGIGFLDATGGGVSASTTISTYCIGWYSEAADLAAAHAAGTAAWAAARIDADLATAEEVA